MKNPGPYGSGVLGRAWVTVPVGRAVLGCTLEDGSKPFMVGAPGASQAVVSAPELQECFRKEDPSIQCIVTSVSPAVSPPFQRCRACCLPLDDSKKWMVDIHHHAPFERAIQVLTSDSS